jgi:alanyl-tRNA synthetase
LRELVNKAMDRVRHEIPSVIVGATNADGKVSLTVSTNDKARSIGLSASAVLKAALPAVDGRGGGKDDVAQGGGTNPSGLDAAFTAARESVRTAVGA